jgi:glycerol kinase
MRWCLDNLPAARRAADAGKLLAAPLASYLALHLGGRAQGGAAGADAANAGRTQLFDSQQLDWSDELLELFEIERAWLPQCTSTRGDWGALRLSGHEVQLRAVTGDQSAVPYAGGDPDPATIYVNLGTGAFIQQPLASRPPSPAPLLGSVLSRDAHGAIYSLEGTVNGAGSAVSWFCAQERCSEDALWPALELLPAATELPIFVNGIGGLGSPWWRVTQESRFVGNLASGDILPAPVSNAIVVRFAALVESIAFMIAVNAEALARQAGPARRVVLAGGMSRSHWLGQRLAALIQLPVEVIDAEASARGVAHLAAPEISARWSQAPLHDYAPQRDENLDARYRQFTDLMAEVR